MNFVLLVFFAFLAINTRYASMAIVIVPGGDALFRFIRNFKLSYFLYSLLAIVMVFLPNLILEIQGSPALTGPILVPEWSIMNFFHRSFFTSDGHFTYTFPNICFVFSNLVSPGYIFTGLLFFLLLKSQVISRPFLLIIAVILATYALFLAGLPTQNSRFLLVTFPCVVILYAGSFFRSWDYLLKVRKQIIIPLIVTVFLIQMALFYRAFIPFYQDGRTIREIAARMKSYPDKTIYTFNIEMGLKAYDVKNEIISLWSARIDSYKPGSLILFNYAGSYQQWKNMNPVYNWEKAKKEQGVHLIEKLPGGWDLYEINN